MTVHSPSSIRVSEAAKRGQQIYEIRRQFPRSWDVSCVGTRTAFAGNMFGWLPRGVKAAWTLRPGDRYNCEMHHTSSATCAALWSGEADVAPMEWSEIRDGVAG